SAAEFVARYRLYLAILGQKRHRLDAVAVRVADEGGIVRLVRFGPHAGCAVRGAAGLERSRMEGVNRLGARGAQADMDAAVVGNAVHRGTAVDPEFRVLFAEADSRVWPLAQLRQAERRKQRGIKRLALL